jgi:hypothetical protein
MSPSVVFMRFDELMPWPEQYLINPPVNACGRLSAWRCSWA